MHIIIHTQKLACKNSPTQNHFRPYWCGWVAKSSISIHVFITFASIHRLGNTNTEYFFIPKFHNFHPFQINTIIEKVDLEGNCIESLGARYMCRVLRDNLYISELVLTLLSFLFPFCAI